MYNKLAGLDLDTVYLSALKRMRYEELSNEYKQRFIREMQAFKILMSSLNQGRQVDKFIVNKRFLIKEETKQWL